MAIALWPWSLTTRQVRSVTEAAEEAVEVIVAFEVETWVPSLVTVKLLHLV